MNKVREFMTTSPVSIDLTESITEAARLMKDHDIGLLPVTRDGQLVGVLTDRDIVVRAVAKGRADDAVGSILSEGVVTVSPDDDERSAVSVMSEHDIRRVPVAEQGRLVGMVSVGDIATRADSQLAGTVMKNTGPLDRPVARNGNGGMGGQDRPDTQAERSVETDAEHGAAQSPAAQTERTQ